MSPIWQELLNNDRRVRFVTWTFFNQLHIINSRFNLPKADFAFGETLASVHAYNIMAASNSRLNRFDKVHVLVVILYEMAERELPPVLLHTKSSLTRIVLVVMAVFGVAVRRTGRFLFVIQGQMPHRRFQYQDAHRGEVEPAGLVGVFVR